MFALLLVTLNWLDESQFTWSAKKSCNSRMQKRHWKWRKTMRQRVVPQIRCVRIFGCSLHRSLFISRMSIHPMGIWFKPSVLIYLRKFEFYYWGESAGRRGPSESDSYWTPLLIQGHEAGSLKDELTSDPETRMIFSMLQSVTIQECGADKGTSRFTRL